MSSDFGQLAVMRHLSSGIDCAIAGAATAADAATTHTGGLQKLTTLHVCILPLVFIAEPLARNDHSNPALEA